MFLLLPTSPPCHPSPPLRCESWDNYCDLFGLLLTSNVNMQLPNIWLWDMVDEFLYQFQVGPLTACAVPVCATQRPIVHDGGVFGA